eukprot:3552864-Amphidinium_carterae.1
MTVDFGGPFHIFATPRACMPYARLLGGNVNDEFCETSSTADGSEAVGESMLSPTDGRTLIIILCVCAHTFGVVLPRLDSAPLEVTEVCERLVKSGTPFQTLGLATLLSHQTICCFAPLVLKNLTVPT